MVCACVSHNEAHAPKQVTTGWYEDDWAGALAEAKKRDVPVFVDVWATWCHTCRSMKTFVLEDPSLPRDRFVWLALDVDKPANAIAAGKVVTSAYPTYFVVDASSESVSSMWIGGASVQQMRAFLGDGERAVRGAKVALPETDPLHWLVIGDRASISGDHASAAQAYARALSVAPADWSRRADVLALRVEALESAKAWSECVDAALSSIPLAGHTSNAMDLTSSALGCAEELPKDDARLGPLRTLARTAGKEIATDALAPLSADDRGDAWRVVWEAAEQMGDHPAALAAAEERARVLENASARAPDAWTASLYDGTRMETLLFLGRAEEARAMLVDHEARLPDDYNPPHRLARVLVSMKRYDDALVAGQRALALAYGPRKAQVYGVIVDALVGKGDRKGARETLDNELTFLRSLPATQARPKMIEAAEKRQAEL